MSVSSLAGRGPSPDDYSNYRAKETERKAANRVQVAESRIQETETKNNTSIDELRDRFDKTYELQNINQNQALEEQKSKGYDQLRDLQRTQHAEFARIKKEWQAKKVEIENSAREYIEKINTLSQDQIKQELRNHIHQTEYEQTRAEEELYQRSNQKLMDLNRETAQKIATYTSRQNDPFYKLITLDAELRDTDREFVLTAKIPEYEQEHITATIRGEELVLSGYRRNEEAIKDDSGHTRGTMSYQTFSESFPLNWPVDPKRLSREQKGDQLIIRIPKFVKNEFREPKSIVQSRDHLVAPNSRPNNDKLT
jgi:HSP20 family molecular chaperone IbpA